VIDSVFGQADHHNVDAVLCAGDLFDSPSPDEQWWRPLSQKLNAQKPDRPIFLLPGNHDPFMTGSIWDADGSFRQSLPDFVHVVDRDDFTFDLSSGNSKATLFARPCVSTSGANDPVMGLPGRAAGDDTIRVAMAHGSTFDMEGAQTNFPISRDAALERGFDYVAIGDTHSFRLVPADRHQNPTVYPGAPEPTSFEEDTPGNVVLVRIGTNRRVKLRPLRVAKWSWERVTVASLHELEALRTRTDLANRVIKLSVEMRLPPEQFARAERLLVELEGNDAIHGRVGVLETDRDGLVLDATDIDAAFADAPDLLQAAARSLQSQLETGVNRPVVERALFNLYQLSSGPS
jgi:DNA repair exonuclease SbcCD nuclease subunit